MLINNTKEWGHKRKAREYQVRTEAARLFLKVLLPLICVVVLVNVSASLYPVFYPQRLLVEISVLVSMIPAVILYKTRREILAMYITLGLIIAALSYGVIHNGGVLAPAFVALMITIVFVHVIVPWWGTLGYYIFLVLLGGLTLSQGLPHSSDVLPPPIYYWIMYSSYGAILVVAQVLISRLFTKQLEQNLEREDQLLSAINAISDPLMITDHLGEVSRLNESAKSFRAILEESLGLSIFDIPLELLDQEGEVTTLAELGQAMLDLQRDDPSSQPVSHSLNTHEIRVWLPQGYRWYKLSFDRYSEGKGLVIHVRDTTAQHKLIQAQKMNAVGKLAGGIAHEFNNMLSAITGSVDLLRLDHRDDQEELIEIIEEGADRASRLTDQLLMFTQRRPQFQRVIDLHSLLESVAELLEGSIDKRVNTLVVQGTNQSHIHGDQRLLMSAIMNLVMNAAQSMPEGGVIILKTSPLSSDLRDKAELWSGALNHEQSYLLLEVIDHGVGISSDVINRIFEPFFTTRTQSGEGIGLTAVYGAVNKHYGAIRVISKVGEGSIFQLALPLTTEGLSSPIEGTVKEEELPSGLRVLLVDDEEMIRQTMESLLRASACGVVIARNGLEGVKAFQEDDYDLVILDVMMPVMDGIQALRLMREHRQDTPVIIHSGYANDEQLEQLSELGVSRVLSKPARRVDLLNAMRAVLS